MPFTTPEIQQLVNTYLFTWADKHITIEVSRLYESDQHHVEAEIRVESLHPTLKGHILIHRMDLLAGQQRRQTAQLLFLKYDDVAMEDWLDMLEYLCNEVLKSYREGEPVIVMSTYIAQSQPGFRLYPFIEEHHAGVLFGDGGTGKSALAIVMAHLVATGRSHLKMEATQGNVLYLDYETDADTFDSRALGVARGLGEDSKPEGLFYRRMRQVLATEAETLRELVMKYNISLVVVDSAALAVGEADKLSPTVDYFRTLTELGIASLTIAHVAKEGRLNDPYGSTFWRNIPRNNFRVISSSQPEDEDLLIAVKHTKTNNMNLLPDTGFRLTFDNGAITVEPQRVLDIPAAEPLAPLHVRIAELLKDGARSTKDIAEALGSPEVSVRGTLNRFRNKRFILVGKGIWGNFNPHLKD